MTLAGRLPRLVALLALFAAACSATPPGPIRATPPPAIRAVVQTPDPTPAAISTPFPAPVPVPGSAIVPGVVDRSSLEVTATYDVQLDVIVGSGEIEVRTVIEARNDSGGPIDRLDLNTIAARLGGLKVISATVESEPVSVAVDDQTLIVPLGGSLPDGDTATIRLTYSADLRADLGGSSWLFSRASGTLALYRWIPWVSRAVPFDRPNHGDPFVTPTSPRVRVRVTTDLPMVLASPGSNPLRKSANGLDWSFEVANVRDAAIVLAPDFELATGEAGGTAIRAYTRPGGLDGDRLVAETVRALTRIAVRLGVPYPWPALTIVETAGGYGMESPGLIWVPSSVAPANLAYLVHHETAHQWFYGLVGNDQQAEPFADEAAADLVARTVLGARRSSRCDEAPLDGSITGYSPGCYFEVVYIQGGNVLDDVRLAMGTDRFWTAIGGYLDKHRFGLGGTRQLLEALRAASPVDLLPELRARFPSLY
jgi:hypothetical protein